MIKSNWTLIQSLFLFAAEQVDGATVSSQPADSTSAASDMERQEMMDEGVVVGEEDGEPNAAELRRRRLRKLETATTSSSSSPPPDNWPTRSDSDMLLWTNWNSELIDRCFGSSLPLFLVALAFPQAQVSNCVELDSGYQETQQSLLLIWILSVSESNSTTPIFVCFHHPFPPPEWLLQ